MMSPAVASIALAGVLLAAALPSQDPPRDPANSTEPTGVIRGQVLTSDTGVGLRDATVMLRPSTPSVPATSVSPTTHSTSTDQYGRFEFTGIPPGQYRVVAAPPPNRARYLPNSYGPNVLRGIDRLVTIRAGEHIDDIELVFVRAAVVLGLVTDVEGDPLARISVSIFDADSGEAATQSVVQTNDLGEFRVFGLFPGEYIVAAAAPVRSSSARADQGPRGPGLVTTYSPGAVRLADAARIILQPGSEARADIRMVRMRLAALTGNAVTVEGTAVTGASIQLMRMEPFGRTVGVPAQIDSSGRFSAHGLVPGEYRLALRSQPTASRALEMARATVLVDQADVEGLVLMMEAGVSVTGAAVADTGSPPGVRVQVSATSVERFAGIALGSHDVATLPGDFTLNNLFGLVLVRATAPGEAGWTMKAVLLGGRDITDVPTELSSRDSGRLTVVLTIRAPTLSGVVLDDDGRPVEEGYIAVFGDDPSTWIPNSSMWRKTRAGRDGRFTIAGLREGQYLVAALPDQGPFGLAQPPAEKLRLLSRDAVQVTLGPGEHRHIEVRQTTPSRR